MIAAFLPAHVELVCTSDRSDPSPYVARLKVDGDEASITGMDDEAVAKGLIVARSARSTRLTAITGHEREFTIWGELRPAPKNRLYSLTWHQRPATPGHAEIWSRAQCVRIVQGTAA